jgi:CBF1 interacting corepressor
LQPLKWELKQNPGGISPPRGGFKKDDPNQQIIAEDIFDEYGGMNFPPFIRILLCGFYRSTILGVASRMMNLEFQMH